MHAQQGSGKARSFFQGGVDDKSAQDIAADWEVYKKRRRSFRSGERAPEVKRVIRAPVAPGKAKGCSLLTVRMRAMHEAGLDIEPGHIFDHCAAVEDAVKLVLGEIQPRFLLEYQMDPRGTENSKWFRLAPASHKEALRLATPAAVVRYRDTGYKISPEYGQYFLHAGGGISLLRESIEPGGLACRCGAVHHRMM